jgi:transcriptional regulator with XRE-family HTH domain
VTDDIFRQKPTTLGGYLKRKLVLYNLSNRALAEAAGVSEGAIRNLLKFGEEDDAKDPDAHTLRQVADALSMHPLILFRLAGYIPPDHAGNSLRAKFLADTFDKLPEMKKDILMGVLEVLIDDPKQKVAIREMQESSKAIIEKYSPQVLPIVREAANQLMAHYHMTKAEHVNRIEFDSEEAGVEWSNLSEETRDQIVALIEHKLTLNFGSDMIETDF